MDTLMLIMLMALTIGIIFSVIPFLVNMIYETILLMVDYVKYK